MLYLTQIENYQAFQDIFGIQEHGNGEKSRRNKILLSLIKCKALHKEAIKTGDYTLIQQSNMADMKKAVTDAILQSGESDASLPYKVQLINNTYHSAIYESDHLNSLCEDGDAKCCRYYNHDNGGYFKMKAGKYLRHLILETTIGKMLPEQIVVYLQEQFMLDWQVYTQGNTPASHLHVDKNFRKIYDSDECVGDFHSCMVNQGYHTMYADAIDDCSAAYLTNDEGRIIARCVIFNNVTDEDGKVWRLAERQYSTDQSDVLKRSLVDALIANNYIDGYKTPGADCHSSRSFVDNNGNSLQDKKFKINIDLETDDPVSYMDSFKFFNYSKGVAYNHEDYSYDYTLDITEGSIDGNDDEEDESENYDSYHDSYTYSDVIRVFVGGEEMTCSENRLDDFYYIDGKGWVHQDDLSVCPICGKRFITDDGKHSELTDEEYCSESCLIAGESEYAKNHQPELAIAG